MVQLKRHVNLLQVIGVCVDTAKPLGIVTEYCSLGSLRSLLEKKKSLRFNVVVKLAKDIAKGMKHLHSEKIIHRDLSARNILISEDKDGWVAKVADFGLSRVLDSESSKGQTTTNTGPLKWMAPEALMNKQYSIKSDVWSYGCTLTELLTGDEPYPALDNVQAASNVMHKGLKPVIPESVPPLLAAMMEKCFERDPDDRPTFKEILKTLDLVDKDIEANPFY